MIGGRSERPTLLMTVTRSGLYPHSNRAGERLSQLRLGSVVEVTVSEPKHHGQLALYWAALDLISKNNDRFMDARALSNVLLLSLGYVKSMDLMDGSAKLYPMSISEMGHQEFNEFFNAAMVFISINIVPGIDIDRLLSEASRR